jgi:hypothetical protein
MQYCKQRGSMKKTVLVTGAGGVGGIAFARSLREASNDFFLCGLDSNRFNLQRAETDVKVLVPDAKDSGYIDALIKIVEELEIDYLHVQTSYETLIISEHREKIPCTIFLPSHETIKICASKLATFQLWQQAGIRVPKTILVRNEEDLLRAFRDIGDKLWLRFDVGSSGAGALPTTDFSMARSWIGFHNGWGKFIASECLEAETVTFESIWKDGELIVAQQRKRLYWEHSNRIPSGVSGITGTSLSVDYEDVTNIALECIHAVASSPSGVFGVDFTYDKDGTPNPTEINAGRLMATHEFFTRAGLNMPMILTQSAFDAPPDLDKKINPLPLGLAWVRGMDKLPKLVKFEDI